MSNIFEEVLARVRDDLGKEGGTRRGRRNNRESQRGNSTPTYSSSSHNDESPKRRRRPPRHPIDYLKDMKIDTPEFEGNLNPDLCIEWIQSLEKFFYIKEYSDEKA